MPPNKTQPDFLSALMGVLAVGLTFYGKQFREKVMEAAMDDLKDDPGGLLALELAFRAMDETLWQDN